MNELFPHGRVGEEAREGDKTVLKITKQQRAEAVFVFGKPQTKPGAISRSEIKAFSPENRLPGRVDTFPHFFYLGLWFLCHPGGAAQHVERDKFHNETTAPTAQCDREKNP